MLVVVLLAVGALVVACYAWMEAGWLRQRVLEVPMDGLPEAPDGVRIGEPSGVPFGAALSRAHQGRRWGGRRANPGLRLHHRWSRLPPKGGASIACAHRLPERALRRARQ